MFCQQCQHATSVVDSRRDPESGVVFRKRACRYCGSVFNTAETFLAEVGRAQYAKKRGPKPKNSEDSIMQEAQEAARLIPAATLTAPGADDGQ